ncbi:Glutathione S-transferase U17 [Linum perenne]
MFQETMLKFIGKGNGSNQTRTLSSSACENQVIQGVTHDGVPDLSRSVQLVIFIFSILLKLSPSLIPKPPPRNLFRQIEEELLLFDKLPHQKLPSNTLEQFGTKSELLLKLDHVYKKIPILIHNDRPICESNIIVEYIDEAWSSGPSLLPSDAYDRAMPASRLPTSTKR